MNMPTQAELFTALNQILDLAETVGPAFGPPGALLGKIAGAIDEEVPKLQGAGALLADVAAAKTQADLEKLDARLEAIEAERQRLLDET